MADIPARRTVMENTEKICGNCRRWLTFNVQRNEGLCTCGKCYGLRKSDHRCPLPEEFVDNQSKDEPVPSETV